MRRAACLAAALTAALAGDAAAAVVPAAPPPAPDRLVVTLQPGARASSALAGARRAAPPIPQLRAVVVGDRPGLRARLARRPGVARVEPDRRHTLRHTPDDPALAVQDPSPGAPAGLVVQWWAARLRLPEAWDLARGDRALVGVVDTGVEATHPELAGRIAGAVDHDDQDAGPGTSDRVGHGTHVASVACAAAGNATALAGAGLGCRLLVLKSDLSDSSVARSIVHAADRGVHALTLSFGTDGRAPAARVLVDALRYARDRGVVLVAAAADEPVEEQGDPANVLQPTGTGADLSSNLGLTVTAADAADRRASFAGHGSQISLAAYGAYASPGAPGPRGIFGAFPEAETEFERGGGLFGGRGCECRTEFAGDRRYAYLAGTSMAVPQVAAVAALARELNPDLAGEDVVRLLKETARRPAGTGWEPNLGWGILDAASALSAARALDRRAPRSRAVAPRRARGRTVTVRLARTDPAPPGCVPSGVRAVVLERSVDGGPWRRVARTRAARVRFRVTPGRSYALRTVAVDRQGNREPTPARPDARVRVVR